MRSRPVVEMDSRRFSSAWTIVAMGLTAALAGGCGSSVEGAGGSGGATSSKATSGTGNTTSTGSGNDVVSCQKIVHATCVKLFECVPAGTPSIKTEQDCEAQYGMGCTGPTSCPLDTTKVSACVADLGMVACSGSNTGLTPPSCKPAALCQSGGQPYCLGTSVESSMGAGGAGGAGTSAGCTLTLDECSDGNTYALSCNGTCTCTVNGGSPKVVPATTGLCGGGGKKNAVAACGWNLYAP